MTDEPRGVEALKAQERKLIIDKVNVLRKRLDKVAGTLADVKSGKTTYKPPEDGSFPDNVYHILPDVLEDFKVLSKSEMPFMEFVACFQMWIAKLQLSVSLNAPHLKNKAVMAHMEEVLETCRVVDYATKAHFGE